MLRRYLALAALACSALVACSGGRSGQQQGAGNPIAFPLFDGAEVLSSHAWREKVDARPNQGDNAVFAQGAGTYEGHDVVAGTQALMPSLEAWLRDLSQNPPPGYRPAMDGTPLEAVRTHARDLGVDFVVFEGTQQGKRHDVVVMTVDPQTLGEKAGPVLGAIGRFKLMPQMLRDPIDAQAKKELGFTLTEATNPDTPIGAAVAALDQLRNFGGRGIVLIDATKV